MHLQHEEKMHLQHEEKMHLQHEEKMIALQNLLALLEQQTQENWPSKEHLQLQQMLGQKNVKEMQE
jgi:hypothetical protein